MWKLRSKSAAVGLEDREEQDGEAPHGEEVGETGHGPLEQLALAGDLDDLGLDLTLRESPANVAGAGWPEPIRFESQ